MPCACITTLEPTPVVLRWDADAGVGEQLAVPSGPAPKSGRCILVEEFPDAYFWTAASACRSIAMHWMPATRYSTEVDVGEVDFLPDPQCLWPVAVQVHLS